MLLLVTSFHYALINRSQYVPRKNLQTGLGSQIKKVLAGYAEAYHGGGGVMSYVFRGVRMCGMPW